jgi:hypothetical protein
MTRDEQEAQVAQYRAMREEAWRIVVADFDRLRGDLGDRGIGERIRDRIGEEAHEAWDYTVDVANEHRGIVAATIAALVAWFLRGPIGEAISSLRDDDDEEQEGS